MRMPWETVEDYIQSMERGRAVAASHLGRMLVDRNCERVHVFANGHVFDRAARRVSIRQNLASQKAARDRIRVALAGLS